MLVIHRRSGIEFGVRPPRRSLVLAMLFAFGIPVSIALVRDVPIGSTAFALIVATGAGEELFFRGYVQARLDRPFGRPWRVLGSNAGWGLVIAAALFGAIHLFNPTLWYRGRFDFAWP